MKQKQTTSPTPLEVNGGKQPANTVGEWTKGKLYIGGQNSIRVDNNEAETWQHPSIFIFTGGNLANANRLIQTWSEYDGLCKTVGKLSLAVSNRDKEIEALKAANRELLEALKELAYVTGHAYDGKPALVKAQVLISKHSKQTT